MANFYTADKITAKAEGGYQDNPKDKGNFYNGVLIGTNHGITPAVYKEYYGKVPTVAEMKALPATEAQKIRKKLYWDKIKGDLVSNQSIANIWYDDAINGGVYDAAKDMQRTLGIKQDGIVGSDTISKVNNYTNQLELFNKYKLLRADEYKSFNNPEFEAGWLKRLDKFSFIPNVGTILLFVCLIGMFYYYKQHLA